MAGVWEQILVAASDSSLAADIRPLVRFNVSVIVEQSGRRERGGYGGGGRTDYRYFLQEDRAMGYAREACARRWSTSRRFPRRPAPCRW
ncbi:hypothetical protein P4123_25200 [Pseudomonas aeruginosa]|nr:hypothetical protein [Pseudomonas aeruginosa]